MVDREEHWFFPQIATQNQERRLAAMNIGSGCKKKINKHNKTDTNYLQLQETDKYLFQIICISRRIIFQAHFLEVTFFQ